MHTQLIVPQSDVIQRSTIVHQVMALVCRLDANQASKEMLLESFMGDFLFRLFLQKWRSTGYRYHLFMTLLQILNLVGLVQVLLHRFAYGGERAHLLG